MWCIIYVFLYDGGGYSVLKSICLIICKIKGFYIKDKFNNMYDKGVLYKDNKDNKFNNMYDKRGLILKIIKNINKIWGIRYEKV